MPARMEQDSKWSRTARMKRTMNFGAGTSEIRYKVIGGGLRF
jgi:hypothetical protein